MISCFILFFFFFFQAEDGIRDLTVTGVQTCALPVLAPFTIIGLALGVTLLVRLPRNATLLALGVFVCGYALYIMLHGGPRRPLGRVWAAPAGLASGVLGALFGVGGPAYVVYIAGRIPDTTA